MPLMGPDCQLENARGPRYRPKSTSQKRPPNTFRPIYSQRSRSERGRGLRQTLEIGGYEVRAQSSSQMKLTAVFIAVLLALPSLRHVGRNRSNRNAPCRKER